jgi:Terminase small subunit
MALTHKQEMFCQAIVQGKNMSEAYRIAYDAKNMSGPTVNSRAHDLIGHSQIEARIAEIRRPALIAAGVTQEGHLAELMRLRDLAVEQDKISEAIRAEELRGKVGGFYVTKVETGKVGAFADWDAQTKVLAISEVKALLDQRAAQRQGATEVTDVDVK